MQCSSCGSDLEPGQPACDFCGTAYVALGEGAGAQVPLQHRLGQELKEGKTFADSQREIARALGAAERAERRRRFWSRARRFVFAALLALAIPTTIYRVVVKYGWAESSLNGAVLNVKDRRYTEASACLQEAARLLPDSAEPWCLQGAAHYVQATRPGKEARESLLRQARSALERALQKEPEHAASHFYLGMVDWAELRRDSAVSHWQKCRDVLSAKSDKSGLERSLLVDAEICLRDSAGGVLTLSCVPRALGGMAEETNEEFPYGRCP